MRVSTSARTFEHLFTQLAKSKREWNFVGHVPRERFTFEQVIFFLFFFSIVTPFDHVYLSTSRESIMYAETYRSIKFFYPFCSNFIHLSILVRQIFDSIIQYRLDAHAPSRFPPSPLISNRKECNILLF